MSMIRFLLTALALALLASCGGSSPAAAAPPPLPPDGATPGATYSLAELVQAGATDWAVTDAACGAVDSAGHYTAPSCPAPAGSAMPAKTCHVQAKLSDGSLATVGVAVAEKLHGVEIVCALVGGQPPCIDPRTTVVEVEPGGTILWIAAVEWSCHTVYTAEMP